MTFAIKFCNLQKYLLTPSRRHQGPFNDDGGVVDGDVDVSMASSSWAGVAQPGTSASPTRAVRSRRSRSNKVVVVVVVEDACWHELDRIGRRGISVMVDVGCDRVADRRQDYRIAGAQLRGRLVKVFS